MIWIGATIAGLLTVVVFATVMRIFYAGREPVPADPPDVDRTLDELYRDHLGP